MMFIQLIVDRKRKKEYYLLVEDFYKQTKFTNKLNLMLMKLRADNRKKIITGLLKVY